MIGRLRQLSEPRLRQQAGIEKSQTPVERDILVQSVRKANLSFSFLPPVSEESICFSRIKLFSLRVDPFWEWSYRQWKYTCSSKGYIYRNLDTPTFEANWSKYSIRTRHLNIDNSEIFEMSYP